MCKVSCKRPSVCDQKKQKAIWSQVPKTKMYEREPAKLHNVSDKC